MSQQLLNILSVVFSICAWIFFIIGCIGYSSTERTLRNAAWITASDSFTDDYMGEVNFSFWVNLAGQYFEGYGQHRLSTWAECVDGDDDDGTNMCSTCLRDGNATFALLIVATVFATFVIILSGLSISAPNPALQLASTFCSFVAGCFSLIGFGLFMGSCYWKIDDVAEFNLHYGPGAIIVLLGLLMMWVTVFFQIGAVVVGKK